ncbi:MAG: autotransporter domain-containing protein [Selenomonadaceae bacterium]|nr:autotransporter domain-containing protein [Selenomonadaceae bacterium]
MKKPSKRNLALAVAFYLAAAGNFSNSYAMETHSIGYNGNNIFNVYYYGADDAKNDYARAFFKDFGGNPLVYNLSSDIKNGLNKAFEEWAEILGPGVKNKKPVQYFVGTNDAANASAYSDSRAYGTVTANPDYLHDALQNGTEIAWLENVDTMRNGEDKTIAKLGAGGIIIGQNIGEDQGDGNYGFTYNKDRLPVAKETTGVDITPIMYHEIAHSLGVAPNIPENKLYFFNEKPVRIFADGADNASDFTSHLYDQNGRRADKSNLWIMYESTYNEMLKDKDVAEALGFTNVEGNAFIVDDTDAFSGRNARPSLTFRGENVTDALGGRTFTDAKGNEISGLPINTWEGTNADFAHIELERSLMSHQAYRSYNTFMEAELALMQDIGYKVDRRNFYGRSIYQNGQTLTNTDGYSARNSDGTAYVDGYNTAIYGVGLHVYGSNNNITQAGNIYTKGEAAAGIRVDGVNNTVTVAKGTEVRSDGENGTGVFAAYGKNHTLNIDGNVTANGEGGVGVWADFGTNSMGSLMEYRGSYIRYKRETENGKIIKHYNVGLGDISDGLDDYSFSDLTNGDLNDKMATINVSGSVEADTDAIHIGSESFVDNVNLNEGASLKGNITNLWKNISTDAGVSDEETVTAEKLESGVTVYNGGLMLQYDGKFIPYKKYVPNLVTNVNVNADLNYDGNIAGANNTKLNVTEGTFNYTGAADVVNVTVAKNAAVYGGEYTVNDQTENLADGYSDETTGQFINHGSIGAANKDSALVIKGSDDVKAKLISDGTLVAVGGGSKGGIEVDGSAEIDGSKVTVKNFLPGESAKVLTATDGITGEVVSENQVSGLMNAEVTKDDDNNISVTTTEANNLGETTSEQNEALKAVSSLNSSLQTSGDTTKTNELRALYNMDADDAKIVLGEVGKSGAADMAALTQQSDVANQIVSERMSTAFAETTTDIFAPVYRLDGKNDSVNVAMKTPVEDNNDIWVKFTKHWGEARSGANYNASAISGGYDKAVGKNWRLGGFISYNAMNLGMTNGGGNVYDTRVGVYGLYKRNAREAFIYANCGWLRNKLRKNIPSMALNGEAKYAGHILEIGGEYKQDLHNNKKMWQVSPFINLQLSQLNQGGYTETGLGAYNQNVDSLKNTYFAGQIGLELKRALKQGNYGVRLGVKHAFSGADPELSYGFDGDTSNPSRLKSKQDKTHYVIRLFGDVGLGGNWNLAGNARLQKGSHDKDIAASITLKKSW